MREWEVKWNNLSMDMQKLMSQKNLDEARLRDSMGIQLSQLEARANAANMHKSELLSKYEQVTKQNTRLQQEVQHNKNAKTEI